MVLKRLEGIEYIERLKFHCLQLFSISTCGFWSFKDSPYLFEIRFENMIKSQKELQTCSEFYHGGTAYTQMYILKKLATRYLTRRNMVFLWIGSIFMSYLGTAILLTSTCNKRIFSITRKYAHVLNIFVRYIVIIERFSRLDNGWFYYSVPCFSLLLTQW